MPMPPASAPARNTSTSVVRMRGFCQLGRSEANMVLLAITGKIHQHGVPLLLRACIAECPGCRAAGCRNGGRNSTFGSRGLRAHQVGAEQRRQHARGYCQPKSEFAIQENGPDREPLLRFDPLHHPRVESGAWFGVLGAPERSQK